MESRLNLMIQLNQWSQADWTCNCHPLEEQEMHLVEKYLIKFLLTPKDLGFHMLNFMPEQQ